MLNIPEELFSNICNNLKFKQAKNLKMTDRNIYKLVNNDILVRLKIKHIMIELKNFEKVEKLYKIRRDRLKLYNNSKSVSMLENYTKYPLTYDLDFHIIIVIIDVFQNLESFEKLFSHINIKNKKREQIIKDILRLFNEKLYNNILEHKSKILRDISLLLLK